MLANQRPANVKSVLNNCVGCKRHRGKLAMPYMGNVPNKRQERTACFTHIRADVFGPFYMKERSEVKRWGLLITCFYTRAVHIKLLEEMTTDCLIQAMRCFTALRGPIQSMTVDNGTNFVGMQNELAKESCVNNSQMKGYLEQNRIEFHFNTPTASHQGRVTECMIRTARDILNGMIMQFKMVDAKTLRTAFYEVTNIINSRPLTVTKITDANVPVVTPNLLLNGKVTPLVAPPPGTFESDNVYGRKRWKHS
ncbi:uncharacterized protein [Watersipora subatra]|uniref:uncharacterized protein n=1 Tax=Watersipora subatra TaxID=2589382 RepID=UPI00355AD6F0